MSRTRNIAPGDIAPVEAARYMGLTLTQFEFTLPALLDRGFPPADAGDRWRALRPGL